MSKTPTFLKVGLDPMSPFATDCARRYFTIHSIRNKCEYTGITTGALSVILQLLNITARVAHLTETKYNQTHYDSADYNPEMRLVYKGRVDMMSGTYITTESRLKSFAFTAPILYHHYGFITRIRTSKFGARNLLDAFSPASWLLILGTIAVIICSIFFRRAWLLDDSESTKGDLDEYQQRRSFATKEDSQDLSKKTEDDLTTPVKQSKRSVLKESLHQVMNSMGFMEIGPKWAQDKTVQVLMGFLIVQISTMFQSSLLSNLLASSEIPFVTGTVDLAVKIRRHEAILVNPYVSFSYFDLLQNSKSFPFVALRKALRKNPKGLLTIPFSNVSIATAARLIETDGRYVLPSNEYRQQGIVVQGCNLKFTRDRDTPSIRHAFMLRRSMQPLADRMTEKVYKHWDAINRIILQQVRAYREEGRMHQADNGCTNKTVEKAGPGVEKLSLRSYIQLFMGLSITSVSAALCFIGEKLSCRWMPGKTSNGLKQMKKTGFKSATYRLSSGPSSNCNGAQNQARIQVGAYTANLSSAPPPRLIE